MASADVIAITKWAISGSEKAYGNLLNPVDARRGLAACLSPASNVLAADGAPTKVEYRHNEPTPQFS
jgi:hypothetical protein